MPQYHVQQYDDKKRLDRFIQEKYPNLSRTKIQKLINAKKIVCAPNKSVKSSAIVKSGESYMVLSTEITDTKRKKAYEMALDIVYEDNDIVVVNKPAGLVTHPGIGNVDKTLVNALIAHFGRENLSNSSTTRPGIVHRLDKETSGFLVVAKNDDINAKLCEMIKARNITRKYIAIAHGKLSQDFGTIRTFIKPHRKTTTTMKVSSVPGKIAVTHYRLMIYLPKEDFSIIECKLETGRTHQIRVHMQHLGHPIVGDKVYGLQNTADLASIHHALFAYKLEFIHPKTSESLKFFTDDKKLVKDFIAELQQDVVQAPCTQQE